MPTYKRSTSGGACGGGADVCPNPPMVRIVTPVQSLRLCATCETSEETADTIRIHDLAERIADRMGHDDDFTYWDVLHGDAGDDWPNFDWTDIAQIETALDMLT